MIYLAAFFASFVLAAALTPIVRAIALHYGVVTRGRTQKSHALDERVIPYLGGLAIYGSFVAAALIFLPLTRQLIALIIGVTILAIVGAVDDVRRLSAAVRLGWQFLAACVVLAGGIGIVSITNPLGGSIDLSLGRFAVHIGAISFHITPIANALSILWMMGMVNTINFLDGLDGLAAGVSSIAAVVIAALALSPAVNQPLVAVLALIVAGSSLGFLPFNFFPAKIFMGDSGAYFLGITLALLAIYSGGKLATIGLVLGFTIIDALWAAIRRLRRGVHPFSADREHLHHLLIQAGLSQRLAVLLLYLLAFSFGFVALLSQSFTKLVAFIILFAAMVVLIASLIRIGKRRAPKEQI